MVGMVSIHTHTTMFRMNLWFICKLAPLLQNSSFVHMSITIQLTSIGVVDTLHIFHRWKDVVCLETAKQAF
jgi:hypothetical protein